MKEMIKLVFVLTVICTLSAVLLAVVYQKTEGPIKQAMTAKKAEAALAVLPPGSAAPTQVATNGVTCYVVRDEAGQVVAVALEGRSSKGYAGDIVLMVGLNADGTLVNYKVLESKETPGLGVKIGFDAFKTPLLGRDTGDAARWTVKKDGGDVDAVTAATISSRAALDAIRNAAAAFAAIKPLL